MPNDIVIIVPDIFYAMLIVHVAYQLSFYLDSFSHLCPHKLSSSDAKFASTVEWVVRNSIYHDNHN